MHNVHIEIYGSRNKNVKEVNNNKNKKCNQTNIEYTKRKREYCRIYC